MLRVRASIGLMEVAAHGERTFFLFVVSFSGARHVPIAEVPASRDCTTFSMSSFVTCCTRLSPRASTNGRKLVTYALMVLGRMR